jgi:hypothetical protein
MHVRLSFRYCSKEYVHSTGPPRLISCNISQPACSCMYIRQARRSCGQAHWWLARKVGPLYRSSVFFLAFTMLGWCSVSSCRAHFFFHFIGPIRHNPCRVQHFEHMAAPQQQKTHRLVKLA